MTTPDDFSFWNDECLMISPDIYDGVTARRVDDTELQKRIGYDECIGRRRMAWTVFESSNKERDLKKAFKILCEDMPEESVQRCHQMARDGIFVPPHPKHEWGK